MIISASRRTDIPSYYSDWFFNRIKDGFVYVRNPMNIHQISKISLSPTIVDGIVFWTKNPTPMLNRLHELNDYTYYFQFTLNPYGTDVEPNVPSKNDIVIPTFQQLSKEIGKNRVIWRYDPIFFNDKLQSAPRVNEQMSGGRAQITGGEGGFEYAEAKEMVDLLNAGALPVGAQIIQEESVGPTLGADSLHKSMVAGIIGLISVILFMIFWYRVPGVIATISLLIYAAIVFAIFKLVPVTLTLAGIAGFILSIGMAVDANVLIFERTKEELKAGRTLFTAINSGFDRAFTSIFDSNMSTVIICLILYFAGSNIVKGFALTLIIGVLVSMFSAITVTKNIMHLVFGTGQLKYPALFGLKESDINEAYEASETKREKAKFGVLD